MEMETDRMKQVASRRRYPRFQVISGGIAALSGSKLGPILNIGRDGLAFRYVDYGPKNNKKYSTHGPTMSIIHKAGFSLHDIACKIITDDLTHPEYRFNPLRQSICSVQFVSLTPVQKSKLEYFIAHFTNGKLRTESATDTPFRFSTAK